MSLQCISFCFLRLKQYASVHQLHATKTHKLNVSVSIVKMSPFVCLCVSTLKFVFMHLSYVVCMCVCTCVCTSVYMRVCV